MQLKTWHYIIPIIAVGLLTACGVPAATPAPYEAAPAATAAPAMEYYAGAAEQPAAPAPTPAPTFVGGTGYTGNGADYWDQMVIKNGEMRLLVRDSDTALDGVTQVVSDTRGYVVSSRVWFQDYYGTNYKYAAITMGVPVEQFENALRRLRGLAIRVLDDTASGEDVTDQFVDLKSQLTNLEATRDRIQSFLNDAKTVDEALRINQQLSDVEAQIEKIKGEMNYLSNRSAFSTITVNLEPDLPKIEPTPTPTATPKELGAWNPGETTKEATNTLVSAYRVIVEFLIWLFVVIVPILAPPALLIWLVVWLIRRSGRQTREGANASGNVDAKE